MHRALSLVLLLHTGCAKRTPESLTLQDKVSDESGPMGDRGCAFGVVEDVRIEGQTLWITGSPWTVASQASVEAFSGLLAVCGKAHAIRPLRDWYTADQNARANRHAATTGDSLATVGATLVAGAAASAAGPAAASPNGDALAHAMRDQNLKPAATKATQPADLELEAARTRLIDALTRND